MIMIMINLSSCSGLVIMTTTMMMMIMTMMVMTVMTVMMMMMIMMIMRSAAMRKPGHAVAVICH